MSRRSRDLGSATATTAATTTAPAPLALEHALQRTPARPRAEALQRRAARNLKRLVAPWSVARARRFSAGGWPSLPLAVRARRFRPSASPRLRASGTSGSAHAAPSALPPSCDTAGPPSSVATASPQPGIPGCSTGPAHASGGTTSRIPSADKAARAADTPAVAALVSRLDLFDVQEGPREVTLPAGQVSGGSLTSPPRRLAPKPTPTSPACPPAYPTRTWPSITAVQVETAPPTWRPGPSVGRQSGPVPGRR